MKTPFAPLVGLCLVLLAPAALATPAVTVDVDADDTLVCQTAPHTLGGPDLYVAVHPDCSATAHADTNTVVGQCAPHTTGDLVPGVYSASVSTDQKCDAFVDVSL